MRNLNRPCSIALFVAGFLLAGCFPSPLFNHADADTAARATLSASAAACPLTFAKLDTCASLEWLKAPKDEAAGQFRLRFWNRAQGSEAGPYLAPAPIVGVKLWMPAMGHGSSPVQVTPAVDAGGQAIPGVYDVSNASFMMNGTWEIWVQLKRDKKILDQAKIDYRY